LRNICLCLERHSWTLADHQGASPGRREGSRWARVKNLVHGLIEIVGNDAMAVAKSDARRQLLGKQFEGRGNIGRMGVRLV
jgi:hypothetical protein